MIVDASSYALVNAIERLLEDTKAAQPGSGDNGDIKPELMESVLEIATKPCSNTTEAGEQLRLLRAQVRQVASQRGLTIGSAGTHPFAMWEDQRIVARPRYRDIISALRFVARQELIFGMHVHVGMDRPGQGDPRRQRDARPRPGAARPERELAVLARRPHRPAVDAHADLPPVPARRHAAGLQGLGRLRAQRRVHGPERRHGGLHVPLVRRAPAPEPRHGRDPLLRLADARRAHGRAHGAHPGDGAASSRPLRRGLSSSPTTRGRCSTRTSGSPRATASRGRSSTCPPAIASTTKALTRRLLDRLTPYAQDLGSEDALDGIRDLLARGNGAARQVVVYEANHDLQRGHGGDRRGHRRLKTRRDFAEPLRRLRRIDVMSHPDLFVVCKNCQAEVSPVHHGMPLLRDAAAQARAEDRAPGRAAGEAVAPGAAPDGRRGRGKVKPKAKAKTRQADAHPRLGTAAQRRDPRHPRRRARQAVGDDRARRAVVRRVVLARSSTRPRPCAVGARRRSVALPHGRAAELQHRRPVRRGRRSRALRLADRAQATAALARRRAVPRCAGRPRWRSPSRSTPATSCSAPMARRSACCAPGSCRPCSRGAAPAATTTPTCSACSSSRSSCCIVPVLSQGSADRRADRRGLGALAGLALAGLRPAR